MLGVFVQLIKAIYAAFNMYNVRLCNEIVTSPSKTVKKEKSYSFIIFEAIFPFHIHDIHNTCSFKYRRKKMNSTESNRVKEQINK